MRVSIAIPDSCLGDDATNLDKSRKVASIARACAIFGVEGIYVYQHGDNGGDRALLLTVLRYMDAPPFLRRRLFPKMNELKYAGVLHPLKIPSHAAPWGGGAGGGRERVAAGDVRDGVTVRSGGRTFADFGIGGLLPYRGRAGAGRRVTARFSSGAPGFGYSEIDKAGAPRYWGYVVRERGRLSGFLESWGGASILTSRKGRAVTVEQIRGYQRSASPLLVVYGSTDSGIHEILGRSPGSVPNSRVLNFFPQQETQTVRVEEAVMGTLSLLNLPQ